MEHSKHNAGTTSVVVHHKPGGASTLSLGGGYGVDKDETKLTGKIGAATVPKPKPAEEEEEEKKEEESK